ncbi:dihydrofolate synthase/folylpolyglutamate synthase [Pseudoxanthomonas japonensis]|uniref:bifunctional tetrahydrofolate synthase/dihydrofolate synthase n=1 Tax=Pseudoxanthomonas japonensis TaxID=69284 RepID=UPI001A57C1EB|nr:bifunctional tetrahydrofolate synthase/dihydrofolate synthase [Pseudoxanthomonas japonensis]MBL8255815.1 bifunctional tetrahydrofolate synthase/dihydrofolate synthase [Pseudoxanthomonas mexicana]MDR7069299.1 dihydrofolate synthase/folylpolyglutamate synthase [Pseudoxanthomonas japonensis]
MSRPRDLSAWLAYIEQQHPTSIDMGLDRVREVATRLSLGKPATRVITVGGTNGKGSTVAFTEAIARAAGWKVGAYTSPHLLRYNERVRIDGEDADDTSLVDAFDAVDAARGDTSLTYFEFGTLAALWLFERSGLDLAVLEIGLGGRLDAVNIVDPDVAVITTVDIDHTDWLGSDREAIGTEKAGIARAWKPLVLGEVDSPSSVLRHAYAIGANALRSGSDFFHEPIDSQRWRWREVGAELELPSPALSAPSQRANAATAIAALRALPGEAIPDDAFAKGVAGAALPGRLQRFEREGVEVVLDVGHNPQAARELAAWLQAHPIAGTTRVVFAALADKDASGVADAFADVSLRWLLAGLSSGQRSQTAEQLAARLPDAVAGMASAHATVEDALRTALAASVPGDRVLVFGSFHTVADALHVLHSGR